jgi:hypothetical protein
MPLCNSARDLYVPPDGLEWGTGPRVEISGRQALLTSHTTHKVSLHIIVPYFKVRLRAMTNSCRLEPHLITLPGDRNEAMAILEGTTPNFRSDRSLNLSTDKSFPWAKGYG